MLAQLFNPTEIKKNGPATGRRPLQNGAAPYPSQQRSRCCLPPAKAKAKTESSSKAILAMS